MCGGEPGEVLRALNKSCTESLNHEVSSGKDEGRKKTLESKQTKEERFEG